MKKLNLAVSALAIMFFVSCKEEQTEPTTVNETTINQTVVDSTTTAPEEEGTKIKVNSDGVEYSDGNTEVEVNKDGGEVKKD